MNFLSRTVKKCAAFVINYSFEHCCVFCLTGYTGFVPRSRGQLGMSYPIITNLALNEFTDDLRSQSTQASRSVHLDRSASGMIHGKPIYPVETGLVPHYTGHIPGMDQNLFFYRCMVTTGKHYHFTDSIKNIYLLRQ